MLFSPRVRRGLVTGLAALSLSTALVSEADAARRGGSFGSRGSRTFQPSGSGFGGAFGAPINRSMTPRTAQNSGYRQPGFGGPQTQRPGGGFLRRWGGPLLGGLALGGLVGMLMGHGMGGAAGMLGLLLQVGLAFLAISLVMRLIRSRRPQPAAASAFDGAAAAGPPAGFGTAPAGSSTSLFGGRPGFGRPQPQPSSQSPGGFLQGGAGGGLFGGFGGQGQDQNQRQDPWRGQGGGQGSQADDLGLGAGEIAGLERTFLEVQEAYGREDYAAIRERSTPEVMGFMAEELGRNATDNRRNHMRDFRVKRRDVTEAWREEGGDYATLAVTFENLDWVEDRATGRVIEGDPSRPVETTEFWTFVRQPGAFGGGGWKVSAIQEAGPG